MRQSSFLCSNFNYVCNFYLNNDNDNNEIEACKSRGMGVGLLRRNLACGRGLYVKEHDEINVLFFFFFLEKKSRDDIQI